MGDELADRIATVQTELGGLFDRPKLSEKLLGKPPFRYLHDIISAVTAATGFGEGLYTGDELDSGAIKDKAAKIAYLEKIISLVGICHGRAVDVRPGKIVAGLEPERTNELLALLGKAAKSPDVDGRGAVRQALAGEGPQPSASRRNSRRDSERSIGGGGPAVAPPQEPAPAKEAPEMPQDRGGGGGARHDSQPMAMAKSVDQPGDDDKAAAKLEMEEMGAAAKAMDVPQSRRIASRGAPRAEAKGAAGDMPATGGMGAEPSGSGKDLTEQIEACTGEIAATQEMLGHIITRPRLADKLLNMPPFRFLHDIISEVTRQTGFAEGLYAAEELESANVKAKPAKIAYLEKIIKLVGTVLNTLVDARPAKIVAGLEPENTNRLLQMLALAATELPDSSSAVRMLVQDANNGDAGGNIRDGATARRQSDDAAARDDDMRERRGSSATAEPVAASKATTGGAGDIGRDSEREAAGGSKGMPMDAQSPGLAGEVAGDKADADTLQGQAATDGQLLGEAKRSMRPRTARRRPPTVKDNTKDFDGEGQANADPKTPAKPVNIMMDGDDKEESDGEIEDGPGPMRPSPAPDAKGPGGDGHTAMVQDILKEQAKDAQAKARDEEAEAQDKKSDAGGIRLGRLKKSGLGGQARAGSASRGGGGGGYSDGDVDKLRDAIQQLCQSAGPLGKCMDYVHEDLALMGSELEHWQALYRVKMGTLEAEQAATDQALQPLRAQLLELEEQAKESVMKINGIRAKIAANDVRINSLLRMVVTA